MKLRYRSFAVIALLSIFFSMPASALNQTLSFPTPPTNNNFIIDQAKLLPPEEEQNINQILQKMWHEHSIPIYVVTIQTLGIYNASCIGIETYARDLFDKWGIGSKEHNNGVLFLVSLGDRKARIELGADYGQKFNDKSSQVMQTLILPYFKHGNYSTGIFEGVQGIIAMVKGEELPGPKLAWWVLPVFISSIILLIAIGISLIISGRKGWGWSLLVIVAVIIGFILRSAMRGGGNSGGGLGGGSSGGGGATGSW